MSRVEQVVIGAAIAVALLVGVAVISHVYRWWMRKMEAIEELELWEVIALGRVMKRKERRRLYAQHVRGLAFKDQAKARRDFGSFTAPFTMIRRDHPVFGGK